MKMIPISVYRHTPFNSIGILHLSGRIFTYFLPDTAFEIGNLTFPLVNINAFTPTDTPQAVHNPIMKARNTTISESNKLPLNTIFQLRKSFPLVIFWLIFATTIRLLPVKNSTPVIITNIKPKMKIKPYKFC